MITAEEITRRLEAAFPGATVRVVDTTGTSDHFEALVVSSSFEGLNRVRQHQAVYSALGDAMRQEIHALALRTFTPESWERAQP
ncbi:MAG: BolA family transcriptional regulator [Deltaproteobacteria bacterium]|nr:MAG: BolA family transcriptional regulator [Deltaproteobacteria bacterium]